MMYEALLFDMNALGDIPDKDFTRTACAGSIPHGERGRDRGRPPQEAHTLGWTDGLPQHLGLVHTSLISHSHQAAGWNPTSLNMRRSESWSPTRILRNCLLEEAFQSRSPRGPDTGS